MCHSTSPGPPRCRRATLGLQASERHTGPGHPTADDEDVEPVPVAHLGQGLGPGCGGHDGGQHGRDSLLGGTGAQWDGRCRGRWRRPGPGYTSIIDRHCAHVQHSCTNVQVGGCDVVEREESMRLAATMYYLQDEQMDTIARRLGTSRSTVSRLLKAARESGLVQIAVRSEPDLTTGLAEQIRASHGVRAHVVRVRVGAGEVERLDQVAKVAAGLLMDLFDDEMVLGVAWNTTVRAVARALGRKPTRGGTVVRVEWCCKHRHKRRRLREHDHHRLRCGLRCGGTPLPSTSVLRLRTDPGGNVA